MDGKKLRESIISRWTVLKQEREPFMDQWLEISRHVTPAAGRFFDSTQKNQARERFNRISTPPICSRLYGARSATKRAGFPSVRLSR